MSERFMSIEQDSPERVESMSDYMEKFEDSVEVPKSEREMKQDSASDVMFELEADSPIEEHASAEKNQAPDADYEKQKDAIEDVESQPGFPENADRTEKGNYGEMKTDQDLKDKGYTRISDGMVTDVNTSLKPGIDGVYHNPDEKPPYIIVESKYGSSQLNEETKDGKQMSKDWIDNRLENEVGKEKADDIRDAREAGDVGCYVSRIDAQGNVTYDKLDEKANVVEKDVKIGA